MGWGFEFKEINIWFYDPMKCWICNKKEIALKEKINANIKQPMKNVKKMKSLIESLMVTTFNFIMLINF